MRLISAREGHFKLESGHHGNLWLDLDRSLVRASQVRRLAVILAQRIGPYRVAAVCGPLVGGAMIAQTIAAELDVDFYYTERFIGHEGAGMYPVRYRVPAVMRQRLRGKDVAVIDDVINAGSAVRSTMADMQACGARIVLVGALLVLGAQALDHLGQQDLPLESLGHLASNLWAPHECPLCLSQVPLEDLTG